MSKLSREKMRQRFHEACAERDAIRAIRQPLRDAYDAKSQELAKMEREVLGPMREELRRIEAPLSDLDQEIGLCARALGGKTGNAG